MSETSLLPALPSPLPALASLLEEERQSALERFRLLQPHLEEGHSLTQVAQQADIPYRTAQRWVALYRRFGLAALARKGRTDCGSRRALSPQMQTVVEALALQKPPLPIAALYRRVCCVAEEQAEKPPSYAVVYDIVRRLPADLVMLAHAGTKAYADAFEMIHRREAERSNAIWQADHTLLDILLVRGDDTTASTTPKSSTMPQTSTPAKPWLTVIIDDYSRAVAGYFLSFDPPSALQTALALRQAIWRKEDAGWQICGIPDVLYTDNGSDFTSRHMEQVAADIKMQLVFSIPGKPRGRGRIERFFLTLTSMFLAGLPGHTVSGDKMRESGMCGQPTLTLAKLDLLLREFLLNTYQKREHSETKMAPKERWEQGGFLPRMPESLEQLDLLLLTVISARKVHPDGIRFQGLRYIETTLAAYIGESVTLRYDPRDLAEIRVFHEGRFLCRAICPELAGCTLSLREVLRARNQRRRDLRAVLSDRKKAVDTLLDLKQWSNREASPELDELDIDDSAVAKLKDKPKLPEQGKREKQPALRRYQNE